MDYKEDFGYKGLSKPNKECEAYKDKVSTVRNLDEVVSHLPYLVTEEKLAGIVKKDSFVGGGVFTLGDKDGGSLSDDAAGVTIDDVNAFAMGAMNAVVQRMEDALNMHVDYSNHMKVHLMSLTEEVVCSEINSAIEEGEFEKVDKWKKDIERTLFSIDLYQRHISASYKDIVNEIKDNKGISNDNPCDSLGGFRPFSLQINAVPVDCPSWYRDPLGYLRCIWS